MSPSRWALLLLTLPPEARNQALTDCPEEWRGVVRKIVASIVCKGPRPYAQKILKAGKLQERRALLNQVPPEHRPAVEQMVRAVFRQRIREST